MFEQNVVWDGKAAVNRKIKFPSDSYDVYTPLNLTTGERPVPRGLENEPAAIEPETTTPTTSEPTTAKPTTTTPTTAETTTAKPTTTMPTTSEPATAKPTTTMPAATEPVETESLTLAASPAQAGTAAPNSDARDADASRGAYVGTDTGSVWEDGGSKGLIAGVAAVAVAGALLALGIKKKRKK